MFDGIQPPVLLVATPQLLDKNLSQTVVLLVEHSDKGAMGFVVNRPIGQSLCDLVDVDGMDIPEEIPAWYGGPVATDNGIILHNRPEIETDDPELMEHIAISSSHETFEVMVEDARQRLAQLATDNDTNEMDSLYPFRFLVGYAGWGEGQLEEEMREGAWIQIDFDPELIFKVRWPEMWTQAMGRAGIRPESFIASSTPTFLN